jgi:DNA-binding PadR family transcriptional regulator
MARKTNLLPQVSFSIMLALSLKPRHGYEIMQQVESDSNGIVKIGPGALYTAIKQLNEAGMISEVPTTGDRRRYYQLTEKGRERLGAELEFFESSIALARERRLLGDAIWAN